MFFYTNFLKAIRTTTDRALTLTVFYRIYFFRGIVMGRVQPNTYTYIYIYIRLRVCVCTIILNYDFIYGFNKLLYSVG